MVSDTRRRIFHLPCSRFSKERAKAGSAIPWAPYYRIGILPIVSIVVPFWGYLIRSELYIWINHEQELQWRP